VLELILFNSFDSHLDDLLGESVLIDDEMSTICSEGLTDLVDLAGTDVGKVGQNNLLMVAKKFINSFPRKKFVDFSKEYFKQPAWWHFRRAP